MKKLFIALLLLLACSSTTSNQTSGGEPKECSMCNSRTIVSPWDYVHLVSMGQSLGAGVQGTPVISTTQPFANVKTFDSSGNYNDPNSGTWSLVPLIAPLRPVGGGSYPGNIFGETPGETASNQLSQFTLATNPGSGIVSIETNVAISGAALSGITVGTPVYADAIREITVAHNTLTTGHSHGVQAIIFTHGESDATNASYASGVQSLQHQFNIDAKAITGQTLDIPLIATQQCTEPTTTASPLSALAILQDHIMFPGQIICVGPKYQYPYAGDNLHLIPKGYRMLGAKYGEVLWTLLQGRVWNPLMPLSYTLSNSNQTITVAFSVPYGPMVFESDANFAPPHQSANTQWQNAHGVEAADSSGNLTIDFVTIVGNSLVVQLHTIPTTGLQVGYALTPDTTGSTQGGLPTGRRGQLRDSSPVCSIDGDRLYNWCVQFQSPILT